MKYEYILQQLNLPLKNTELKKCQVIFSYFLRSVWLHFRKEKKVMYSARCRRPWGTA